jgi:hypothetical protein
MTCFWARLGSASVRSRRGGRPYLRSVSSGRESRDGDGKDGAGNGGHGAGAGRAADARER